MSSIFGPDYELNRKRLIDQARSCAKGVGPEQLVPGAIVTHGPNKGSGDRSGVSALWRVLAANGGHVALEAATNVSYYKPGERTICVIAEHEWYPADHMLSEIEKPAQPKL